jgi:shikimate kinase
MTSKHIISLIGFPGSGKSTVGVLLAKRLGTAFVDTDILIQTQENATLAEIIARSDHHPLRKIEEQVLLDMPITTGVISTGGSVVYSEKIMQRLASETTVVYLQATLETVDYRISLAPDRGIASGKDQTLADIYRERIPLYEQWAALTVSVDDSPPETIVSDILRFLS